MIHQNALIALGSDTEKEFTFSLNFAKMNNVPLSLHIFYEIKRVNIFNDISHLQNDVRTIEFIHSEFITYILLFLFN